jgi:tRNA(Ile)-lysidine synthase
VLKQAAEIVANQGPGLELIHYDELLRLATGQRDGSLTLSGVLATRSFNRLRLSKASLLSRGVKHTEPILGTGLFCPDWLNLPIRLEHSHLPPDAGLQVFSPGCRYNGGRHWFDGDLVAFPLVLRVWRPGDRFQPQGAKREYSLRELFRRLQVPRWERDGWPVIVSGSRIVWARRFGVADWAAAAPGRSNPIEVIEALTGSEGGEAACFDPR